MTGRDGDVTPATKCLTTVSMPERAFITSSDQTSVLDEPVASITSVIQLPADLIDKVVLCVSDASSIRALHCTCHHMRRACASLHLQCEWLMKYCSSPLHLVARRRGLPHQLVELLIQAGCSPTAWLIDMTEQQCGDASGRGRPSWYHHALLASMECLPIHVAALHGNTWAVDALVRVAPETVLSTPHVTSQYSELKQRRRDNHNVSVPSQFTTALHLAALGGCAETLSVLLAGHPGLNPDLCPGPCLPASPWSRSPSWPAMWHVIRSRNVLAAKVLLRAGSDPNFRHDGRPLLDEAVLTLNPDMVRCLLTAGTDTNKRYSRGHCDATALHAVVSSPSHSLFIDNKCAIAEALLEAGCEVDARMADSRTPLHSAVRRGDLVMTKVLLKHGADVNLKDLRHSGISPLHEAASTGSYPMIRLLLTAQDADVNIKAADGSTPLHFAAKEDNFEVVEALLLAGADPNVQDDTGTTPLHKAAWAGHAENAEVLLWHGCNPDIVSNNGRTALDFVTMKCQSYEHYHYRELYKNVLEVLKRASL